MIATVYREIIGIKGGQHKDKQRNVLSYDYDIMLVTGFY